jgi:hypothetical protein
MDVLTIIKIDWHFFSFVDESCFLLDGIGFSSLSAITVPSQQHARHIRAFYKSACWLGGSQNSSLRNKHFNNMLVSFPPPPVTAESTSLRFDLSMPL